MGVAKKRADALAKYDQQKEYGLREAVQILKEIKYAKFDETVDLTVNLGVDPKHADQMVRGVVSLPHGLGTEVRVVVFAEGDLAKEAEEAGADFVGSQDLMERIQKEGWLDFDKVVAAPDMMKYVGRLGKVLGPRGLMPNPKVGTVTPNIGPAVKEAKAGKIQYRVEKAGIVHARVGKVSFAPEALVENASALLSQLVRQKPATAKGTYIKSITVSSTMGPGVRVDPAAYSGKLEV